MEAGVFTLTVPQEEEQSADGTTMGNSLHHRLWDGVTEDDTHGEISLRELSHREAGEANESEAFKNERLVVRITVHLPLSDGVSNDREVVSIGALSVHLDKFRGVTFVGNSLSIEISSLIIEFFKV